MIRAIDVETAYCDDPLPWGKDARFCMASMFWNGIASYNYVYEHDERVDPQSKFLEMKRLIEEETTVLIGHNMSFDLHWLTFLGIKWRHLKIWDTKIAEYLIRGQRKTYLELNSLREQYGLPLKDDYIQTCWRSGIQTSAIPIRSLVDYCDADASTTYQIAIRQMELARKAGVRQIVSLHMQFRKELNQAEWNGMVYDVEAANEQREQLINHIEEDTKSLTELVGYPINLNSSDQVSAAIFGGTFKVQGEEWIVKTYKNHSKYVCRNAKVDVALPGLGFKPLKGMKPNAKGMYSTNAKLVLAALKTTNKKQVAFLEMLKRCSSNTTMLKTYYDGLLARVCENGILHPRYHQVTTGTGRISSSNPNGQNIPRSGTAPIKKLFRSRYGTSKGD